ncbi:hypothetical protein [Actinomyces trachealis]|uniref:hypothetical protein n=1 Tax=Actinomyces trachealis TaxID=2763540 RepID=UPI001892B4F3|nr:hypothetical protein [Actinomyces trachealis]
MQLVSQHATAAVYLCYRKGLQGTPQWGFVPLTLALAPILNMMNVKTRDAAEPWFAARQVRLHHLHTDCHLSYYHRRHS